jgi:hypothetical protein
MELKPDLNFQDFERILDSIIKQQKRGLITDFEFKNKIIDLFTRFFI